MGAAEPEIAQLLVEPGSIIPRTWLLARGLFRAICTSPETALIFRDELAGPGRRNLTPGSPVPTFRLSYGVKNTARASSHQDSHAMALRLNEDVFKRGRPHTHLPK